MYPDCVVHLNHLPSKITMDREVLCDPVGDILVHVGDRMELCFKKTSMIILRQLNGTASGFPPSPIHDIMFDHF